MPPKTTDLNKYLLLRGATWHLHWNVPKDLRGDPLFRNKAIYAKSLRTKDVYEARKMRDILVAEFKGMATVLATHTARRAFMGHYAKAKKANAELAQRLTLDVSTLDVSMQANHEVQLIEQGDYTCADAYLEAINKAPDVKHALTLHEATQSFIKAHEGKIDKGIISRAKNATNGLMKAIADQDVTLEDVTARHVTRWMKGINEDVSDSTRNGYMSALQRVWQWAWENEKVDGVSPFKGNKIPRRGDGGSYEDFTLDEMQALVSGASPALLDLMRFGLVTGCRLSELTGLAPDRFTISEGVHVIQIFEGKTRAATRTIPLPLTLWVSLKQAVESGLWEKTTAPAWSQRFGELKLKATGKKDRTKGFHSFRHMAATAYEREHIEERITSVLLGHKNRRGESMSYGLYSAGLAPKQYLEAVEKMLTGEYMQSFLSLFN